MAVIVNLKSLGVVARVEGLIWSCDTPGVAEMLERRNPAVTGSDPDPDLTVARAMVRAFGGSIVQKRAAWHPDPPATP